MLFKHGMQHHSIGNDLDRILAVIHSDNAIELLLKDRVKGTSSIHNKQIPALLNDLRTDSVVSPLSGDIRLAHEIRNYAYHLGISPDTYTLIYVTEITKRLFTQFGLLPDGGVAMGSASSEAEIKDALIEALRMFTEAKLDPDKKGFYTSVTLLCFTILEKLFREKFEKEAFLKYGDGWQQKFSDYRSWSILKLIEIFEKWRTFKDPVLSLDLRRLVKKRNIIVHTPKEVSEKDAQEFLQVALHFAGLPQPYFEAVKAKSMEDAIAQALHDYDIPFEMEVEFRLGREVFSRFDFVIPSSRRPIAIIEAKLGRIRPDYFKALLFDVELLKRRYPWIKFYIVYSRKKVEETRLSGMRELSVGIADGFFDLSEITAMLKQIQEDIRRSDVVE
jgi:hypothetical protein